MPSQQIKLPKFLADSVRGETCLEPKLKKASLVILKAFMTFINLIEWPTAINALQLGLVSFIHYIMNEVNTIVTVFIPLF